MKYTQYLKSLIFLVFLIPLTVNAKTEQFGRNNFKIDKCVLVKDAFFRENQFNSYTLLVQCADLDEMQAYANGQRKSFMVYTLPQGRYSKNGTKGIKLPVHHKKGAVWTFIFNYHPRTGQWMWDHIYAQMTAKPFSKWEDAMGSDPEITYSEYVTTVDKLLSGEW
ncbi:hypothetical protein VQ643_00525 [Pseudomonas sp. F1_0610]|uniref:hypothetical protein n=1 Tax=Pseudomonas sp. F1_0610 TaxID=3114284 RepID=UPI0039C19F62